MEPAAYSICFFYELPCWVICSQLLGTPILFCLFRLIWVVFVDGKNIISLFGVAAQAINSTKTHKTCRACCMLYYRCVVCYLIHTDVQTLFAFTHGLAQILFRDHPVFSFVRPQPCLRLLLRLVSELCAQWLVGIPDCLNRHQEELDHDHTTYKCFVSMSYSNYGNSHLKARSYWFDVT